MISRPFLKRHRGSDSCESFDEKKRVDNLQEECEYGCGNVAKWRMKNGKYCCSKYPAKCREVRSRNGEAVSKAWSKSPWSLTDKSGGGWNKGKSYEEIYGKDKAEEIKSKIADRDYVNPWEVMSEDTVEKTKRELRKSINKRYENGWMPKAGICKKIWYESDIAGRVSLDGSWELNVAKYFDEKEIEWRRNTERFEYYNEIEDREAKYIPDFYLPERDVYIEVKGYETELDRCKWEQFDPDLVIWKENELKTKNII